MSNGSGPLLPNLQAIRHEGREYWLGCAWTSFDDWVEIGGLGPENFYGEDRYGEIFLPTKVACKIAAAILYAEVYDCRDNQATPLDE